MMESKEFLAGKTKTYQLANNVWYAVEQDEDKVIYRKIILKKR